MMTEADALWTAWLRDLEEAAARLERQLAAGELLDFPDLSAPPIGSGSDSLPPHLMAAACRLLDRLERLERVATIQRDGVAAKLASLSPSRGRPKRVPAYDLGAEFDVAG